MRLAAYFVTAISLHAQWTIQQSNTIAGLRGVHSLGKGVAWASGTGGTVLRTTNDGKTWKLCAIPPGADKLDFRGVQASDRDTAVVMSSGPGDQSRIYRTKDACRTWKLVFTNPDEKGFWDVLKFTPGLGVLMGDAVNGSFPVFLTFDDGQQWVRARGAAIPADHGEAMFAASNSSLLVVPSLRVADWRLLFLSAGDKVGFNVVKVQLFYGPPIDSASSAPVPLVHGETSGGFSLAANPSNSRLVAVGGDYKAPNETSGTAAYAGVDSKGNFQWYPSETSPHGYRSAVAYHEPTKSWIAVGPNGTDISDNARDWTPLTPAPNEARDADRNWNALSLPFVVGPNGRIGKLREEALKPR